MDAEYYQGEYDPTTFWESRAHKVAKWEGEQPDEPEIREVVNYVRPAKVLELGCGPGRNVGFFNGSRYTGVDISRTFILRAAKAIAATGKRWDGSFRRQDITDLRGFIDSAFDLVFADSTLQHIPPDKIAGTIAEAFRVSSRYVCCIEYTESDSDFFEQIHLFQHDYAALAEPYGNLVWQTEIQKKVQPARKELFLWEKH